jgi:hypothetical protein
LQHLRRALGENGQRIVGKRLKCLLDFRIGLEE